MIRKLIVVAVSCLLTTGIQAQSGSLKDQKIFEVKSGKIEYTIDGKTKGTKTLWWDDYGRLQCEIKKTTTKMMGMTTKEELMTIRNKEAVYNINLLDKTGTRMSLDDIMAMTEAFAGTTNEAELKIKGEQIRQDFDAHDVGTETILGRTCTVMDIGKLNGKHWRYKEIPLKVEIKMGPMLGNSVEEAVEFEENISVPSSRFEVPAGITIEETPAGIMGF